jgi:hypothetical protein
MDATRRLSRNRNVALLAGSFAFGYGILFLVQSWLVYLGELRLLGLFGASFTFALMASHLVDWGGLILLARRELAAGDDGAASFWNFSFFRLAVALAILAAVAVWAALDGLNFATAYALAAAPSLLLVAFNPGGMLDGLHKSGATGVTAVLPTLVSAAALPAAPALGSVTQGLLLGGAFALGTVLCVLLQHREIARAGRRLHYVAPSLTNVHAAGREGGVILLTMIPGWLAYRGQVAIALALLGPSATGLFVYAKQIANAGMQMTQFVRRAEFPRLMETVREAVPIRVIARAQCSGLLTALAFAVAIATGGLLLDSLRSDQLGAAAGLAALFGPVVFISAAYAAMNQAFVAAGRAGVVAGLHNFLVAIGLALAVPAALRWGPAGFALMEIATSTLGIIATAFLWRKVTRP